MNAEGFVGIEKPSVYTRQKSLNILIRDNMIPVQIRVTKKLIETLDELVESGRYSNRSQAIRDALRRNLDHYYEIGVLKKGDRLS